MAGSGRIRYGTTRYGEVRQFGWVKAGCGQVRHGMVTWVRVWFGS